MTELPRQRSRVAAGRLAVADQGDEYSTEVPQQTWICTDLDTRPGTVTCGDGRGWTCCLFVCKQGVMGSSPLSSTGQRENSNSESESTAVKYSNRAARDAAHAFELGLALAGGGAQIP